MYLGGKEGDFVGGVWWVGGWMGETVSDEWTCRAVIEGRSQHAPPLIRYLRLRLRYVGTVPDYQCTEYLGLYVCSMYPGIGQG